MRIAVIGAGVVGVLIARELARYEAQILVFEREPEPGFGVTKANSAIVHAGFHDEPGTLRARFCVLGNALFPEICAELSVPFQRVGAFVLAFTRKEETVLWALREQGEANGVPGLELIPQEEVLAREPRVNPAVRRALWAPTVGITVPWALAQAAAENAQRNGVQFHFEEEVQCILTRTGAIQALRTPRGLYKVEAVVNAAGLYADRVAALAGAPFPPIRPRRGQYVLLDETTKGWVSSVLFPPATPVDQGHLVVAPGVRGV
ncbi:MAG: FAD-dependent oxidoreductase, partial [Candidatus Bipolaricaulaceae bacterium]